MSSFSPTHVVDSKHDDARFPAQGTRVRVWAAGDEELICWQEGGKQRSRPLILFFAKNHLRRLTSAELAAEVHVHG